METSRCRAFIASVETGSFTKAARILDYTPSGVSQLVSALEDELGVILLNRNRKGVSLTADGEMIISSAREMMRQEECMMQISANIRGLSVGSVSIAAYSSVATHWLPAVIREFQTDHPGIEVKLMEGIRQEVDLWLSERRVDMAFMSFMEPMQYEWVPLAEDPMIAVISEKHPLAGADSYPLKRCCSESFIMPALGRDADVVEMFERNGIEPDIKFSTLENFAAMAMIEQDLGMSIMNELITKNWNCNVVKLPLDPPQHIDFGIAVHSLKESSPAARTFIRYAVKHLSQYTGGATVI